MKYFHRKLLDRADSRGWQEALDNYRAYYKQIEGRLPENVRQFGKLSLHDGVIESIARPSRDRLELRVDVYTLIFTGVQTVNVGDAIVDDVWLYNEIYLLSAGSPAAETKQLPRREKRQRRKPPKKKKSPSAVVFPKFELLVLLELSELRVVAEDVFCFDHLVNRWKIGGEGPPGGR